MPADDDCTISQPFDQPPTVFELHKATFNVVISYCFTRALVGLLDAVGGDSVLGGRDAVDVRAAVLLFLVSLLGDLVGERGEVGNRLASN